MKVGFIFGPSGLSRSFILISKLELMGALAKLWKQRKSAERGVQSYSLPVIVQRGGVLAAKTNRDR